jgi:hypothetical protein
MTTIQNQVLNEIKNVMPTTGFTATVTQPTTSGIPMVQVEVKGTVSYLFHLLPSMTSFSVDRTVTFRDELR